MTYNSPVPSTSQGWGTNYPPKGMVPGSSNYPPSGINQLTISSQGLQPRVIKAKALDPHGDGSGYRPFWDFSQESVDASALHWQVTTNINGDLAGLYIQAPYGYQDDLLRAPKSKILTQIADEMDTQGHKNWAETIRKDQIAGVSWRSSSCQAFGFSYDPLYSVDKVLLQGLSSWQPYEIDVLHPELMAKLAPDEVAQAPKPTEKAIFDMVSTGGWVGAASFTVMALASSWWLMIPAIACGVIGYTAKRLAKNAMKANKRSKNPLGPRPGYILKTTSGWAVILFDSSTHASPADLSNKAMEELNNYLERTNDPDASVGITQVYTSTDGKMTFFQSDRTLQAECELSPYKAEQYLSLYARHQAPALKERAYTKSTPTVINGTMMLQGVQAEYASQGSGFQGASEWSPEAASARAAARTREMENQVLSALGTQKSPALVTGDTEKARFMQIVHELQKPGIPDAIKKKIQPKLNDLHESIAMLSTLSATEVKVMRKSIDDQLTEMESQLGGGKTKKQSVKNDLMSDFQKIMGSSVETPAAVPMSAPSPSSSATGSTFNMTGQNPFKSNSSPTADPAGTSASHDDDSIQLSTPSDLQVTDGDTATPEMQDAVNDIASTRLDLDAELDNLLDGDS